MCKKVLVVNVNNLLVCNMQVCNLHIISRAIWAGKHNFITTESGPTLALLYRTLFLRKKSLEEELEKNTRSGKSYFTDSTVLTHLQRGKPILKKNMHKILDMSAAKNAFSKLGAGQKNAVLRGIALARSLGLELQKGALLEYTPGMALNIYNGDENEIPKASHKRHVIFAEKMKVRNQGLDSEENTIFEKKRQYKCYLTFVFEPMYDLSMSELILL